MVHRRRPQRQYTKIVTALWQVWKIDVVVEDAIWETGQAEFEALNPDHVRVAVWNICKGAGGILFEHDYRIISYLSDLILLQEALLSRRSLRMFCEHGFEVIHGASYMRRDHLRDGVMTASRVASRSDKARIICKYPEPILNTPKAALASFYPLQGRSDHLMVVNLHATLIRRLRRAVEELESLMQQLPTHDGPMIFAGDFNTFTPTYLEVVSAVLKRYGLTRVPIDNDPRSPFGLLDQIFLRGIRVKKVVVDTTIASSDHFPIICHVAID